jgi:hypothetical protein
LSRRPRYRKKCVRFNITRHGIPIGDHPAEGLETGISYDLPFEELEACEAAGLDMVKWNRCEYSVAEKITVVAWYRASRQIRRHVSDAEIKESKKKK